MFSFICHHFVVGGEELWNILIRESCGVREGDGLKKLISCLVYIFIFHRTIYLDVKITTSFTTTPARMKNKEKDSGSSRILPCCVTTKTYRT